MISIFFIFLLNGILLFNIISNIPNFSISSDSHYIQNLYNNNKILKQVFAQQYYGDYDNYNQDHNYYYKNHEPIFIVKPVLCIGSGLLAADKEHCPIKCTDGTYIMQGMECPKISNKDLIECEESGFIVNDQENCPQKCEDGTYIMQGMECPLTSSPPPTPTIPQLTVIKNFNGCIIDSDGTSIDCPIGFASSPEEFTINVDGNNVNPSSVFAGSDTGTVLTLDEGEFNVTEQFATSPAPFQCAEILGTTFDAGADIGTGQYLCTSFSDDCEGNIGIGDELTCIVENTIAIDIFMDLAVGNRSPSDVSVLLGDGDGTFTEEPTESPINVDSNPPNPRQIFVSAGFFNDDTILDLAVTNSVSDLNILLGDGDGTFTEAAESPISVGVTPSSVTTGFFNDDIILDLAVSNQGDRTMNILLGDGDGTFTEAAESPISFGLELDPIFVTTGFFNDDSNLDLVIAGFNSNNVAILLGDGDGTFTEAVESPISVDTLPISIAVGFFDNDDILDLAVGKTVSGVSIFLGDGDGTFTEAAESPINSGINVNSVAVGFFNNDELFDLAVANSNDISIFLGDGDGTFTEEPTESPIDTGDSPFFLSIGFFNADPNLDLAVANQLSNNVAILLGDGDGTFTEAAESPISVGNQPRSIAVGNFN